MQHTDIKQIFFLGGAPKSGNTWLQIMLNAHPEISCSGEGHFVDRLLPLLSAAANEYNGVVDFKNKTIFDGVDAQPLITQNDLLLLLRSAIGLKLTALPKARSAKAIGDKTPDNVRFFGILAKLFPDARFINIVRDGRDCLASAWFHNLRVTPDQMQAKCPTIGEFIPLFANAWSNAVALGTRFVIDNPARGVSLRYEDLCQDPLPPLANLCTFLGASTNPAILDACVAAGAFERLSGGRAAGQEDRGSFFRMGIPGDWRNHLSEAAAAAFREKAEPWMSHYNYV